MAFTDTLFGGLVAVIALFFAARRLRLSAYWSGLLSAALPLLAYLGLNARALPEGDVIAIHLAVFVAAAGMLAVFGGTRREAGKMHWGPKLIIAFFAVLVLLMAGFVAISMNGLPDWLAQHVLPDAQHKTLHTGAAGLTPHDPNRLYEEQQQRLEAQRRLGWQVRLDGLERLHKGMAADLTLHATDAGGAPLRMDAATLGLWRMADRRSDRQVELTATSPGVYAARISLPTGGRWVAEIRLRRGDDSYLAQWPLVVAE